MRVTFSETLAELATNDSRIVLFSGDPGFMALDSFITRHPSRFFNVGVAEQNMIGLATGMAQAGFIPFVYSIVPFAVLRPFEFIRNGPIQHGLPVRIVGVGAGFDYSRNGLSHYGLDVPSHARMKVWQCSPPPTTCKPAPSLQPHGIGRSPFIIG